MREVHHRLSVEARLGPLHLRAEIALSAPWTVLFGPSGSGKSSLLRAACGLIAGPARSCLSSSGEMLDRTPTHRRNLAYAPQGAVLFPHLTVRENIAFAGSVRQRHEVSLVEAAVDLFRLGALAERYPRALSGGERQRVALARAFAVPAPRLMLLDEPFTGIDRALRDQLLPAMATHLAGRNIPVLSVTHDVEEALLLDAEVLRMAGGQVVAQGPVAEVLAEERGRMLDVLAPRP